MERLGMGVIWRVKRGIEGRMKREELGEELIESVFISEN